MEGELLKNEIKNQIDKYEKISNIIFTTFDFDTVFFENQLLPYLFEISSRKNIKEKAILIANDFEEKIKEKNTKFYNTKISVYYDHFIGDVQANINYKAKEIKHNGGVFHPKLIIINGISKKKKIVSIIVLSANLTTSSYGTNVEVAGIVEKINEDLSQKIEKLESNDDNNVFEILNLINNYVDDIFITGIRNYEKDNLLKEKLSKASSFKVITPFINDEILNNYNNLEVALTTFSSIDAKVKNKINEKLDDETQKFSIKKVEEKNNRKIHAKIYIINNNSNKEMLIGSHNFTTSAINGKNVEASYLIKEQTMVNNFEKYFNELYDCLPTNWHDIEVTETETNTPLQKSNIEILNAKIDWNEYKVEIILKLEDSKEYNKVKIAQIGNEILNEEIILDKSIENNKISFEYKFSDNTKFLNLLYKSKFFKIEIDDEYEGYGIFFEIGKINKLKIINAEDYFELLQIITNGQEAQPHLEEANYSEEKAWKKIVNPDEKNYEDNVKENKYKDKELFEFYKKLNNEFNEILENKKDNKEEIIKLFKIAPDSICQIINSFAKYMKDKIENIENENELLYFLLTVNEQKLLIEKYKKIGISNKKIDSELEENYKKLKHKVISKLKGEYGEKATDILEIYLNNLKEE